MAERPPSVLPGPCSTLVRRVLRNAGVCDCLPVLRGPQGRGRRLGLYALLMRLKNEIPRLKPLTRRTHGACFDPRSDGTPSILPSEVQKIPVRGICAAWE